MSREDELDFCCCLCKELSKADVRDTPALFDLITGATVAPPAGSDLYRMIHVYQGKSSQEEVRFLCTFLPQFSGINK